MWIVQVALRRPYTFLVMALLILLATPLVLSKMSTDIFPEINIPVISTVWNYAGLSAQEVGQRITAVNERSLTTSVNDIEHIRNRERPLQGRRRQVLGCDHGRADTARQSAPAVQIHGQQFLTAVYLIKALGGGWRENATTARGD